jgi:hypothetical protein
MDTTQTIAEAKPQAAPSPVQPSAGATYDAWLELGNPDYLLRLQAPQLAGGHLDLLLTCDRDRDAQATQAADRARAAAALQRRSVDALVGTDACPLPLSPVEWETIEDALLRADVEEELAERGLGDTVELTPEEAAAAALSAPQGPADGQGAVTYRMAGAGAYRRALDAAMAAVEVKRQLGGRLEALAAIPAGADRAPAVQAWEDQAGADWVARVKASLRPVQVTAQERGQGRRAA